MGLKLLLLQSNKSYVYDDESMQRISTGELRASSRGKTEGASVIRIFWV